MTSGLERSAQFLHQPVGAGPRAALLVAAVLIVTAHFLPLWNLTMFAPQYPDGLRLDIFDHSLVGAHGGQDIKEINILNHYIGMAEIRPDEFREFVFIPFFILRFIAFAVLATLVARMPIAAIGYIDFALFGAVMMFDFHTWLTRFGQGLAQGAPLAIDPFTPKFFGTTQIGQFTVDSYPALGGVLMIAAGTLGPVLLAYELWRRRRAAST